MRVCVIPARGGSRRIPRKNIRLFHGKPIIAYSIEAAQSSGLFHEVWVSTEDSEIGAVAMDFGAKWYPRPDAMAHDEVGTQEVVAECLKELSRLSTWQPEYAACVYATAPLMTKWHLRNGFALMQASNNYTYVPGWFYFGRAEWFGEKPLTDEGQLAVEPNRYIDINTEADWQRAEQMYATWETARRMAFLLDVALRKGT